MSCFRYSWLVLFLLAACAHRRAPSDSPLPATLATEGATLSLRHWKGEGRRIILVHGGPGRRGYMSTLARRLPGCRMSEYQQRGDAASVSPSEGPFTVETAVKDLEAVISYFTQRDGKAPILLGHSWGGQLMAELLDSSQPGLHAAVMIAPGALSQEGYDAWAPTMLGRLPSEVAAEAKRRFEAFLAEAPGPKREEMLKAYVELIAPAYFAHEPAVEEGWMALKGAALGEGGAADSALATDYYRRLAKRGPGALMEANRVPLLVYLPEYDINHADLLRRDLAPSRAEVLVVEDAGHFPWLDTTGESFIGELRRRLARLGACAD